jgi:hypothetical protein
MVSSSSGSRDANTDARREDEISAQLVRVYNITTFTMCIVCICVFCSICFSEILTFIHGSFPSSCNDRPDFVGASLT